MPKKGSDWFRQNKLTLGISTVFLAVGVVLGLGLNYRSEFSMRFDDKINATDLLQVFVGIILVWLIASSLEKKKLTERNSKDILQRRVRELYTLVEQFSEHKFTDNYEYTEATSALKRIETGLESIKKLVAATGLSFPDSLLDDVNVASADLDNLLTNTPVIDQADGGEVELAVVDNVCTFGGERLARIHESFDKFKDDLLELEIRINVQDVPGTSPA